MRSVTFGGPANINVPNDKARAVVDAMERDIGTTIATKTDLQILRQELLSSRMVIQLGSMLVVGFGLTIAALKFFPG